MHPGMVDPGGQAHIGELPSTGVHTVPLGQGFAVSQISSARGKGEVIANTKSLDKR